MIVEIKVPSPGESISEVEIANWLVEDGEYVEKDQEIAEVESDKATLPLIAEKAGEIRILAGAGETIKVGEIVCSIDSSVKAPSGQKKQVESPKKNITASEVSGSRLPEATDSNLNDPNATITGSENAGSADAESIEKVRVSPVAAKMMEENELSVEDIVSGLKRIGKKEVQAAMEGAVNLKTSLPGQTSREVKRQRMSSLRRKLAERLVAVKNETAMLTTFNECDMTEIIGLRKKYQPAFVEKHGVKLGFMSFFVKAVTESLRSFPNVNSRIDGEDMLSPDYCDIGIAVQTDKGLMVPVIRNAESLSLAGIESAIMELAEKARAARISLEEMSGGSFTITNGGVFGSMLSTPILNPPQSAILGMHNIQERPIAVNGQIEIRPMMYIALSYDHRLIDGRDSVSFLVKVKDLIENPFHMMFNGIDPEKVLLEL